MEQIDGGNEQISRLMALLAERDEMIAHKDYLLAEKDEMIFRRDMRIKTLEDDNCCNLM